MWHKAIWMGHPMGLELTREGLLVWLLAIYHPRCPCEWSSFVMQKDNIIASSIPTRFSALRLLFLRSPDKGFKRQTLRKWWGSENWKWLKEQSTEFYEAGIYALIRRCNIAIERNDGSVENRDGTHRGLASFRSIIYVPVSVIIPILKKKALLFY